MLILLVCFLTYTHVHDVHTHTLFDFLNHWTKICHAIPNRVVRDIPDHIGLILVHDTEGILILGMLNWPPYQVYQYSDRMASLRNLVPICHTLYETNFIFIQFA